MINLQKTAFGWLVVMQDTKKSLINSRTALLIKAHVIRSRYALARIALKGLYLRGLRGV